MKPTFGTVVALLATMGLIFYLSQNPRTPTPEPTPAPAWTPAPVTNPSVQEPVTDVLVGTIQVATSFGCVHGVSFGQTQASMANCDLERGVATFTLSNGDIVTTHLSVTPNLRSIDLGDVFVTADKTAPGGPRESATCRLINENSWTEFTSPVIFTEDTMIEANCTFANNQTVSLSHFVDILDK